VVRRGLITEGEMGGEEMGGEVVVGRKGKVRREISGRERRRLLSV
jgi:hypothetical protein